MKFKDRIEHASSSDGFPALRRLNRHQREAHALGGLCAVAPETLANRRFPPTWFESSRLRKKVR
jgi:hypothetical protein